jgi:hypothetical protein
MTVEFAAAIGREVEVTYIVPEPGIVRRAAGRLGIALDADDVPTDLVLETDGAALFIPVAKVAGLVLAEEAR